MTLRNSITQSSTITWQARCFANDIPAVQVCETLIAYARSSLKRFDTVEDTTGRVLAGGVANRWNTRLKVSQNHKLLHYGIIPGTLSLTTLHFLLSQ